MVNSASGLLVVGVGRSGTSIATRLSLTLGLLPPRQSDLMPANYANPTGYWESVTLAAFNDALLAQIGATWWTPPPVETAALNTAPAEQRSEARQAFTAAFGCGSGWVWKDPRLTALLPFWDDVLGKQPVLVPVREPREVAASIAARDKLNAKQSLAVWERHTRLLWSALAGRQALICRYADLISDPTGWRRSLADFCAEAGLPVSYLPTQTSELLSSPRGERVGQLTSNQQELQHMVEASVGAHGSFPKKLLPPESPDTSEHLASIKLPNWAGVSVPPHERS